jgi:hypothetical protein
LVTTSLRRRWPGIANARDSLAAILATARTRPAAPSATGKLLLEPPDNRRLDRRRRRTNELAHLFELGHDRLALYPELLSEFVNPDLRHYAPLLARSRGPSTGSSSADPGHSAPGRRQSRPFIALCSSSAHQLLDLLSVQVVRRVQFAQGHNRPG